MGGLYIYIYIVLSRGLERPNCINEYMSLVKGASSKKSHYKTCNILSANFTCLLFLHMVRAERGLSNGPPFVGRGLEQQKHYKTLVV